MCNYKHDDSKVPKRSSGIAYKIFKVEKYLDVVNRIVRDGPYRRSNDWNENNEGVHRLFRVNFKGMTSPKIYRQNSDGWIHWNENDEGGFCCLPNKRIALRLFKDWTKTVPIVIITYPFTRKLYKVEYRGAFARHKENNMLYNNKTYDTILVKSFKILELVISE